MKFGLLLPLLPLLALAVKQEAQLTRDGKVLSLFNIVTFKNEVCETKSTSNSKNGTCYTATECTTKGGTASGNCAAGFGVCCLFTISAGSSSTSENNTYIQNPSYPSVYSATTGLTYTIKKCSSDICSIRLDFEVFAIVGPSTTGEAAATTTTDGCIDSFVLTGSSGLSSPRICGTNAGQHMYLDIGNVATDTATLTFTFATTTSTIRTWDIKVAQIPCGVNYNPPSGCLQWFIGKRGLIQSYNWGGVHHLPDQDYSICIRKEEGMCCVRIAPTTETDSFSIAEDDTDYRTNCPGDYINIEGVSQQCTRNAPALGSRFCGKKFVAVDNTAAAAATPYVCDCSAPFEISFYSDNAADAIQATNLGFSLEYQQVPCN